MPYVLTHFYPRGNFVTPVLDLSKKILLSWQIKFLHFRYTQTIVIYTIRNHLKNRPKTHLKSNVIGGFIIWMKKTKPMDLQILWFLTIFDWFAKSNWITCMSFIICLTCIIARTLLTLLTILQCMTCMTLCLICLR